MEALTRILYVLPYGSYNNTLYVPECETSKAFCKLLKQKTLTAENLEVLKELGYEIKTKEKQL